MKKLLFILFFSGILNHSLLINSYTQAHKLNYVVSMEEPHKHYFKVQMSFPSDGKKLIKVKMPVWAPGSYLVREFARHVDSFGAKGITADKSKILTWQKSDKNTWDIETSGYERIEITYTVYAFELSVRTSFLDDQHGFISGSSVFMYVDGKLNSPGNLQIQPWKGFSKVSCGLERIDNWNFTFPDYDALADAPIEIGNHEVFSFEAAGLKHEVAMFGEGNYNIDLLKKDMATVVEACTKVYGENPNKYYLFIVHNLTTGSGGLEHLNSTTLQVNRWTYTGSSYNSFLSLVAHEYFHLWNVKRSRPLELGPFNYDKENYTELLWVMEGFTSYYDELLLKRAGFYNTNTYLGIIGSSIGACENTPGSKVQSAAESSFDAWIKGYRTNENSVNSQISYYTKGQVLGILLDMEIIAATKGAKKLDDLMLHLYNEYYKKLKRGFTAMEFRNAAEKIAGKKVDVFFNSYVNDVVTPDYAKLMEPLGLIFKQTPRGQEPWLGARFSESGGKLVITSLIAGSSGYEGGLNVNDEIISIDGWRVDQAGLNKIISMKKSGDVVDIIVSRDGKITNIKLTLIPSNQFDYQVQLNENATEDQKKLQKVWLN
jgi:predicted metalloprotease with PDZ domain